jgi:class 3 adenylate cyclase/YHS domain-containing protein
MEENIAMLIADLSGYSALTETHGSFSAANLIDKYMAIVENCLDHDSKLHERTGDEVIIVSTSTDSLLKTAFRIIRESSGEENFLQIHGGLHIGKLLKRKNSYFGSAINITSRIAAAAKPGTFWCSEEFARSLSERSLPGLKPKGKHRFKNISEEQEMYEASIETKNSFFIDPVCRMQILDVTKAKKHRELKDIFFCSSDCLDIYSATNFTN